MGCCLIATAEFCVLLLDEQNLRKKLVLMKGRRFRTLLDCGSPHRSALERRQWMSLIASRALFILESWRCGHSRA